MTAMIELSDAQWCVLDLLVKAKQCGAGRVSKLELLNAANLPPSAKVKLVFAALTMPPDLVMLHGQHDFEITEKGEKLFDFRFGQPTGVAECIILLPDRTGEAQ